MRLGAPTSEGGFLGLGFLNVMDVVVLGEVGEEVDKGIMDLRAGFAVEGLNEGSLARWEFSQVA